MVAIMRPLRALPIAVSMAALWSGGCAAAEFGDDFANNLLTDLAPLLALFGERVTMQFMSQSTSWADNFILAMAPLGIVTIIVSAIRVGGPSWLKAVIGRARENLAAAEVELMSSRSMGSAPIREFICIVPKDEGAMRDSEVEIDIIDAREAQEQGHLIKEPTTDDQDLEKAPSGSSGTLDGARRPAVQGESEPKIVIVGHRDADTDAPNISLNLQDHNSTELRVCAVVGSIIQMAVIIYSAFATYYPTLRYSKEEQQPVAGYAFPCMAAGTYLLSCGLVLCANVVEGRSKEETYKVKEGYEARIVWIQRKSTVGDQVFASVALFGTNPRDGIVTSRRLHTATVTSRLDKTILALSNLIILWYTSLVELVHHRFHGKPALEHNSDATNKLEQNNDTIRASKTTISMVISLGGFIAQFVGIRGLHWSVSIVQLGAILAMTVLRAWVRRRLASPPKALPLTFELELEWLAFTLEHRNDGPWYKSAPGDSMSKNTWQVQTGIESTYDWLRVRERRYVVPPIYHKVMRLRSQLGELTGWRGPAFEEAEAVCRAIEVVMATLFANLSNEKLFWTLEVNHGPRTSPTQIVLRQKNGNWTINRKDIEAILSLWLSSASSLTSKRTQDSKNNDLITPLSSNALNLRLLGQPTVQLLRDLRWWMPQTLGDFIIVKGEKTESPTLQKLKKFEKRWLKWNLPEYTSFDPSTYTTGHERSLTVDTLRIVGDGVDTAAVDVADRASNSSAADATTHCNNTSLLATESFGSLTSLYALDLFRGFMWAAAKTLDEPVDKGAQVISSAESGRAVWNSFTLNSTVLSKMVNDIATTGIASLGEIYTCIIPPLSAEQKLPPVECIVEMTRKHALPYEQVGDMNQVLRDYFWLLKVAKTFPRGSVMMTKALVILGEYITHIKRSHERRIDWSFGYIQNFDADNEEKISSFLKAEEHQEVLQLLKKLHEFQRRSWTGNILPPSVRPTTQISSGTGSRLQSEGSVFPKVFQVSKSHSYVNDKGHLGRLPKEASHVRDICGWTVLHYLSAHGYYRDLADWWREHEYYRNLVDWWQICKGVINSRDLLGWTPLHCACRAGNTREVEHLIKEGADVNAQARDGILALHCAALIDNLEIAKLLVQAGANVDMLEFSKSTPLMYAVGSKAKKVVGYLFEDTNKRLRNIGGRNVLHLATWSGSLDLAIKCKDLGINDGDARGRTPLHLAAQLSDTAILEFFVRVPGI
ncbi:hypothetical protein BJ166DRAFT_613112 [Pestalotiopsis sp. NC0098]|nr:hypothetical protein BJ166DRAFT_613112 [Pestalotiopsis sp. NC0098]